MVEILLKYIEYTPTLANEKQLHEVAREMSYFCQPTGKLKEIRNAYEKQTLLDYILNTNMDIGDKRKIEQLRVLNAKLDTSPKADGRLWTKLAQEFPKRDAKDQVLRYIEMAINNSCEKEATNYLLELLEDEEILKEEIPTTLFKAAFMASIDANQLTSLLLIMPKRNPRVKDLSGYLGQMKAGIELNNSVATLIVKEQAKNPSDIKRMLELTMEDKSTSDRVKMKLLGVMLEALPKESEMAETIRDLKQNYEALINIKKAIRQSNEEDSLDEQEFLNNKSYREQMINKYAKLMIGMNLFTHILMSYLKGSDYTVMAISALFDKPFALERLTKECDAILESAKVNNKEIILEKILPICKTNTHYLYCIGKLATKEDKPIHDTLLSVMKESVPIQYFYNFGEGFIPKEPEIYEDHKALIKTLITKDNESTSFLHNLYMIIYKEISDENVYVYYNLLCRLHLVKYKELQPLLVFPLWLLKKLDWLRPQFGHNRSKHIKNSATLAFKWTFSKVQLESFLTKEVEKVARKVADYLKVLLEYEIKKQSESLTIGVISIALHKLIKKQLLSLKEDHNLFLSELFYRVFKASTLTSETIKLFQSIKSLEIYSVLDYCIKAPDKLFDILIAVSREHNDSILTLGKYVKDVLQSLTEAFISNKKFPQIHFYYGLNMMKLNERLSEIKSKWEVARALQVYMKFAKVVFPEIANEILKCLWSKDYTETVKNVAFIMFENEFSEIYGEETVRAFLLKVILKQLKSPYKDLKTPSDIIEFIKDYLKNNTKGKAKEYSNLLALGMISVNYIEKTTKGNVNSSNRLFKSSRVLT
jgi:hypothetical protein